MSPPPANILPLRPRDHEDAARVAISWLGYLLGHDGPYLIPGQKAWITQLRERPLRLYRVTDVRPGEGLMLVDELDAQAVRERSGSQSARPGMLKWFEPAPRDAGRRRPTAQSGRHQPRP